MKIYLKKEDKKLTIKLDGKLDTNTSPELDSKMNELEGMKEVIIDMKELDYISSAGLRVLLSMQKVMNKQGKMTIINVCENVMDIFEVTGFSDILTII
jgi:anti-sigma B factor antagonist